jgi:hypothetical protein
VLNSNFSHSMVIEFLSTSKHRMGRDVWIKNINTYLVKCKYVHNVEDRWIGGNNWRDGDEGSRR